MMTALRVAAAFATAATAAAIAGGAVAQAVGERRDLRRYPPPGQLVDVGGHRLHLNVGGKCHDGPAVVLEAGMGSFSANWHWVHTALAPTNRVVSYDRAGLGWSDRGPRPRDAAQIASELHTALHRCDVGPPYILVGHSFGGLPVRVFADLYPDEVVGLVLADASHPDQWTRWPTPHANRLIAASQRVVSVLARVGLLRLLDLSKGISTGLLSRQVAELRVRSATALTAATEADQMSAWPTSQAQVNAALPLGGLPLALLGVTEQPRGGETLTTLQEELARLSSNSTRRIVQGASHESLVAEQQHADAVVVAIQWVLSAAQAVATEP